MPFIFTQFLKKDVWLTFLLAATAFISLTLQWDNFYSRVSGYAHEFSLTEASARRTHCGQCGAIEPVVNDFRQSSSEDAVIFLSVRDGVPEWFFTYYLYPRKFYKDTPQIRKDVIKRFPDKEAWAVRLTRSEAGAVVALKERL